MFSSILSLIFSVTIWVPLEQDSWISDSFKWFWFSCLLVDKNILIGISQEWHGCSLKPGENSFFFSFRMRIYKIWTFWPPHLKFGVSRTNKKTVSRTNICTRRNGKITAMSLYRRRVQPYIRLCDHNIQNIIYIRLKVFCITKYV